MHTSFLRTDRALLHGVVVIGALVLLLASPVSVQAAARMNHLGITGKATIGSTVNPPNLNVGKVGHWTFDGKDMTQNVKDTSGQGNTGRLSGFTSTTTVSGKAGQGLYFGGSPNGVLTSNTSPTASFSVSFWMKPADWHSYGIMVDQWNEIGGLRSWAVAQQSNGTLLAYHSTDGAGAPAITSTRTAPLNVWTHVVVVYDSADASTGKRIYIGGKLNVSGAYAAVFATAQPVYMGYSPRFGGSSAQYFKGALDDVRIYDRALPASEVAQLNRMGEAAHQNTTITPPNLVAGLVGHWTFDGKNLIQNVTDSSGSGNTGRLGGFSSTTTVPGKIGQALSFGTNQYVDVGSNASLLGTGSHSISAWVKPAVVNGAGVYSTIFAKGSDSPTLGWGMYIAGYGSQWDAMVVTMSPSQVQYDAAGGTIIAGQWAHVTGIFDNIAKTVTLYVNGSSTKVTATGSTLRAVNSSYMGISNSVALTNPFVGVMDEVRVYNRALSAAEVMQLYRLGI